MPEKERDLGIVERDRLAARLAVAPVRSLDGRTCQLRDYWSDATSVTSFVRHFGCLFCHQMVNDLVQTVPRILSLGAQVVIVGNGSVDQARHFFRSKNLPVDGVAVLTDPDRNAYQAAGFERGYARTFFKKGAHRAFATARAQGHRITGLFGDLVQLGGVLVVKPPATLAYFYRSRYAGDHPDMQDVLAAVRGTMLGP